MELGFIGAMYATESDGAVRMHSSLGRVIEGLAAQSTRIHVSLPTAADTIDETRDHEIKAPNLVLHRQPYFRSSAGSVRHFTALIRSYFAVARESEAVVIRGMVPFVEWVYIACLVCRARPVHWLVGNPRALLRSHQRTSPVRTAIYLVAAEFNHYATRVGQKILNGWIACNGEELAAAYAGPRTITVVSSTVSADEIVHRSDACQDPGRLNLVFVGFLRPEKGLEYLLGALGELPATSPWKLTVVGDASGFPDYGDRIRAVAKSAGIDDRITWAGYIPYGVRLREIMGSTDVLILPSLSEGTPRVLIEARANGVLVIASRVGGIPSSVRSGHDGILVPAKDPAAIAAAITALHADPEHSRTICENGYRTAARHTVENFVREIYALCTGERDE